MPFPFSATDPQSPQARVRADPSVAMAVRNASLRTGTRFDLLMASARLESGFRPDARASTSSAVGLFQFTEQSWLDAMRRHGPTHGLDKEAAAIVDRGGRLTVTDSAARDRILALREDPEVAAAMAGDHLREISQKLTQGLRRAPDAAEVYLGHFLGAHGARQMLSADPGQAAAGVLPAAARSNATLFYGKDGNPHSVREFVQRVRERVGRAFTDIGMAMPTGSLNFAERVTPTKTPDSPEAGAAGWGTSTPRQTTSAQERQMLASLIEVVSRVDRGVRESRDQQARRQTTLPSGMLMALQASGETL